MKSIRELRDQLDFFPTEISNQLRYFVKQNIDWNVFLPTKRRNLQRPFVWNIQQKRELINSMLIGRHIPACSIIYAVDKIDTNKDVYQIIDGKQRLSTMATYLNGEFSIEIDGAEYYFNQLPKDYQMVITSFHIRSYVINEPWGQPITDQQKINWFRFINFAGTPQDAEHLQSLSL